VEVTRLILIFQLQDLINWPIVHPIPVQSANRRKLEHSLLVTNGQKMTAIVVISTILYSRLDVKISSP
jgi:hypothetical protein